MDLGLAGRVAVGQVDVLVNNAVYWGDRAPAGRALVRGAGA